MISVSPLYCARRDFHPHSHSHAPCVYAHSPPLALALAFFFSLSLLAVLVAGSKFCRFFGAGLCSMNNNQQPAKVQLRASCKIITDRCTRATIGDFPSKPSHAAQSRSNFPQSRQPLQPRERDKITLKSASERARGGNTHIRMGGWECGGKAPPSAI